MFKLATKSGFSTVNSISDLITVGSGKTVNILGVKIINRSETVAAKVLVGIWPQTSADLATPSAPLVDDNTTPNDNGQQYYYRISALKTSRNGETNASASTSFLGNSVLSGSSYNKIDWTAVTGAYRYRVYKSTDNTNFYLLTETAAITYNDTGTAVDTTIEAPEYNTSGIDARIYPEYNSIPAGGIMIDDTKYLGFDDTKKISVVSEQQYVDILISYDELSQ